MPLRPSLFAVLVTFSLIPAAPAQDIAPTAFDFAPVTAAIEQNLASGFDGWAELVLVQGGRVIYKQEFGTPPYIDAMQTPEPGIVPIASSTKLISGAVIAGIVHDRAIGYDDVVEQWLPGVFPPANDGFTVAQGWSHSSGLPSTVDSGAYPNRNPLITMEQAVTQIAEGVAALEFTPGTGIYYGGLGMQTTAYMCLLAEAAARPGEPAPGWLQVFRERIGDPVGMPSTDYDAYTPPAIAPTANPNTAGSIRTNIEDYGRFITMLNHDGCIDGRRVLPTAAIEALLTDRTEGNPVYRSPYQGLYFLVPYTAQFSTGLGCFIDNRRDLPATPEHPRGVTRWMTSAGAWGTAAFLDRDRHLAGVLVTYQPNRLLNPQGAPYNPAHPAFFAVREAWEAVIPTNTGVINRGDRNGDGLIDGDDLLVQVQDPVDINGDEAVTPLDTQMVEDWIGREGDGSERWVLPQDTDPAIDQWLDPHFVALDESAAPRARLMVFLPGTGAIPEQYTEIVRASAELGFHAIGLRYANSHGVNGDLCGFSTDPDCHEKVRFEILEGVDTSELPEVDISAANSIRNRLAKLLLYLSTAYPSEGWDQYLDGGDPAWDRIAVAGHSQGGGHSAFIAKQYEVWRVVMFAGGADIFIGKPDPFAPWLAQHVTPASRYWGFVHQEDAAPVFVGAWAIFGMPEYGPPREVESLPSPYLMTHELITSAPPPDPDAQDAFHNTVIADEFLARDEHGRPIYLPVWRYLLTTPSPGDAFRMSPDGVSYIDPEVLSEISSVTFQDQGRNVWYAPLDRSAGGFASADGRDVLVDTLASPPAITNNGPEFGLDSAGWAIFYNKDGSTPLQTWRATVADEVATNEPLTSGEPHLSALVSKNPFAPTTKLFSLRGTWEGGGTIAWFDEEAPQIEYDIEFVTGRSSSAHWITGSDDFVFAWRSGPDVGQVAYYDTDTLMITTLTNDAGVKSDPWGWFAPEYGGELLLLTVIDESAIGIYRDLGGPYWERVATLEIPAESQYPVIGSPEPFVANGKSYMTLTVKGEPAPGQPFAPSEIWLFGIDDTPEARFVRRCDDGTAGAARLDPEWFVAREQVFVYYNLATADAIEMWGCPTGIPVGPPGDCDHDGMVDVGDALALINCLAGPGIAPADLCACHDVDGDGDVDLADMANVQAAVMAGL